jgi:flagellar FliL protein
MVEENKGKEQKNDPKKGGTLLVIGLFSLLIALIVVVSILIILLRKPAPALSKDAANTKTAEHKEELGPIVPIAPEIIVNIVSESGAEHYLKVNICLEVRMEPGKKDTEKNPVVFEITKRIPQIRDTVISILRGKTKDKIDQKEGKDLIRSEIINSVNKFLISGAIKNVYFQDFVIQ